MRGIVSRAVRTGVTAIGDNLLPMFVLWSLAAVAVFGYCRVPVFAAVQEPVADWQRDGGWAAREFLSLGLSSFAYFGFTGMFWSEERGRCFDEALRLNGRVAQTFTCRFFESGKKVAEKGFRNRFAAWLKKLPKPCGLFAANDLLAIEAMNVCHAVGIAVPEEIAVLGVDNDEIACENAAPTLSRVRPNFEEAGFLCAQFLGERLARKGRFAGNAQQSFAAAGIVRRQSTRLLPKSDAEVSKAIRLRNFDGDFFVRPADRVK